MRFRSNRPRRRSILSLLRERIDDLEERLELIEDDIGINSSMANDEGNVGSGNVGVGSTAPTTETQSLCPPTPDGNVGDGNVGDGNVGSGNVGSGNVGIGSA